MLNFDLNAYVKLLKIVHNKINLCFCRMLFFSSCGNRPSLETASMTGQERKILHQWAPFSTHCPHGLHYDRDTNRLYWTDGGFDLAYYLTVSSKIVS